MGLLLWQTGPRLLVRACLGVDALLSGVNRATKRGDRNDSVSIHPSVDPVKRNVCDLNHGTGRARLSKVTFYSGIKIAVENVAPSAGVETLDAQNRGGHPKVAASLSVRLKGEPYAAIFCARCSLSLASSTGAPNATAVISVVASRSLR